MLKELKLTMAHEGVAGRVMKPGNCLVFAPLHYPGDRRRVLCYCFFASSQLCLNLSPFHLAAFLPVQTHQGAFHLHQASSSN